MAKYLTNDRLRFRIVTVTLRLWPMTMTRAGAAVTAVLVVDNRYYYLIWRKEKRKRCEMTLRGGGDCDDCKMPN